MPPEVRNELCRNADRQGIDEMDKVSLLGHDGWEPFVALLFSWDLSLINSDALEIGKLAGMHSKYFNDIHDLQMPLAS